MVSWNSKNGVGYSFNLQRKEKESIRFGSPIFKYKLHLY